MATTENPANLDGTVLLALTPPHPLGHGYRFSVATGGFNELQRETFWRWASQEVIGGPPRKQYVGPGNDTMTIQGTIFPQYRGGLGQVDAMRDQAGLGVPFQIMTGWGKNLGYWVITRISEIRTTFTANGKPKKIDFVIGLEQYAPPDQRHLRRKAIRSRNVGARRPFMF